MGGIMRLKNKKTGEIADIEINGHRLTIVYEDGRVEQFFFDSLKDLEEWEDYEEPKEYWHIFGTNITKTQEGLDEFYDKRNKEIGNYFETREEAEQAVEKLKAWKRLKDKGFSIYSWDYEFVMVDKPAQTIILKASAVDSSNTDLDLLFGGEE